jgi:hypothetical protein
VGFHGRRVEENLVRRTIGLRERLKETDAYALARRSSRSFALTIRFGLRHSFSRSDRSIDRRQSCEFLRYTFPFRKPQNDRVGIFVAVVSERNNFGCDVHGQILILRGRHRQSAPLVRRSDPNGQ